MNIKHLKHLTTTLLALILLAGCGSGSNAPTTTESDTAATTIGTSDTASTTIGTVDVAPAAPAKACQPVDIFLFGDSTQELAYSWEILRLVNEKCPGSSIKNYGMGGQDSRQALAGLMPFNTVTYDQPGVSVPTFEQNLASLPRTGRQRIVVTNWGINSFWHGVTDPGVVLADMVRIHALIVASGATPILETPNPIWGGYIDYVAAVASMERGLGYPLIDQFATCAAMDCRSNMEIQNGVLDLVHPGPAQLVAKAAASAAVVIQQAAK